MVGYPAAYRSARAITQSAAPYVASGSQDLPLEIPLPINDNIPTGRPPWVPRPLGFVTRPSISWSGISISGMLLESAADALQRVLDNKGDFASFTCADPGDPLSIRHKDVGFVTGWGGCLYGQSPIYYPWSDLPLYSGTINPVGLYNPLYFLDPTDAVFLSTWIEGGFPSTAFAPLAKPLIIEDPMVWVQPLTDYASERGYASPLADPLENTDPFAPPPTAPREPPEPGMKEKKFKMNGKGTPAGVVAMFSHAIGEGLDALDALWKGLPKNKRTPPKCGTPGVAKAWGNPFGAPTGGGGGCYVTPQQKAADLFNNLPYLDLNKAMMNLINNEIGDAIVGRTYGAASKLGLEKGFKTSGVLNQAMIAPPVINNNWGVSWSPFGADGPTYTVGPEPSKR